MTNKKNKIEQIMFKIINSINKYFLIVEKTNNRYIKKVERFTQNKRITFNVSTFFYLSSKLAINIVQFVIKKYNQFSIRFYKVARYMTFPTNKLWIMGYLKNLFETNGEDLLDDGGIHYIQSNIGGGKSSLMFAKAKDYRKSGKSSYVTSLMEKPKFSKDGWYVYMRYFKPEEFFKDSETIMYPDVEHFDTMIYDEMQFYNNPRRNKEKKYNDIFIPMLNNFILTRHIGMKRILIASQVSKNDIQLMSLISYYHKIKVKKGFNYQQWLKDGKFKISILGWKIKTYTVEVDNNSYKLHKVAKWFKKNHSYYLNDFETLNMKQVKNNIKIDDIFYRSNKIRKGK